jgi:16S rRNA (adenine1518-N6/adenine1519-N6)-dimethyltransferase
MVQKEVAERICSEPGSRVYGILSVLLRAWYDIEYLFTVSEHVFSPPPKVKSAVIRLTRNNVERLGCDEKLFVSVVKRCFNQRRKMLRNPVKAMVNSGAGDMPLLSRRAEQLSVSQFVELTNWVEENRV